MDVIEIGGGGMGKSVNVNNSEIMSSTMDNRHLNVTPPLSRSVQ
jgi:hypothetical protein